MIEVAQTRQSQAAYAARGAAFVGLFRALFRSAAPAKTSAGTYGTVPLT
ncbi:hypothetical protein TL5118_02225 [Thalassovita autumnalis]|uniref:Uncharacterized protein n=1 Tax=Thalassovita autumnalis TaxID=2072972 RepID=A0A0N7LVX6_9RHOB|nr:hypothetical protein [Thalassovita autumnalis]CUH67522.1 hypothetical protein TL5118_02225 [Thalassovita autumnalis]CUH73923.1 hypothetical protein TL5120_03740 [Thalassovita autumnalis]